MNAKSKTPDVLSRMVDVLVREYQPEKIVLFGSYAYGTPHADSDFDILIVKDSPQPFFQRLFEVRRLVSEVRHGYAFDFIVLSPVEIEERLQRGNQFIKEILERGVVMYAR